MTRVLRLLTLVLSFAALQLTLVRGGPGCVIPAAAGAHASVTAMAAMAMAGRSSSTHSAPCDESSAPKGCPTMAPCVFAVVLPSAVGTVSSVVHQPSTVAVLAVVRTPPSETPAPDLPPPRA